MFKNECLQKIEETRIIAVIRTESADKALRVAQAILKGGINLLEIALTVPNAIDVIKELKISYPKNELVIGAGTVLDSETARAVILAGAEYVISPHLNQGVIEMCNRYQKLCIPGAMTITEIVTAMEAGADVIKLFPADILGSNFVKAVKGPLPQVKLIPTGGVDLNNMDKWIKNGCIAVGVGGSLTVGANNDDYDLVTATARKFVDKIMEVKKETGNS